MHLNTNTNFFFEVEEEHGAENKEETDIGTFNTFKGICLLTYTN